MPIFMDRHDIPGVSAKAVAAAHQEDLKIQHEFDCKGLTYWFDEDKGMAFCLVEAPDKQSVQDLHDHAHGLIPNQVIEVEPNIVEAFLGRIEDPDDQSNEEYIIINDPAFRAIMVIYLDGKVQVKAKVATPDFHKLIKGFREMLSKVLHNHNGLAVAHSDECFMASFTSVTQAVLCAQAIQEKLGKHNNSFTDGKINARIGISAGVPVSGDEEFFGPTVKLAKRLGAITPAGQIMVASLVNDLYKAYTSDSRGKENAISALNPADEELLGQIMDIMETNGCDAAFGVRDFVAQMGMSKSQLYRKITFITGLSPNDFIREYRLKKAVEFIEKQQGNISEIAYASGFSSLSYFSKCFQKRFGILPSDYANAIA